MIQIFIVLLLMFAVGFTIGYLVGFRRGRSAGLLEATATMFDAMLEKK